ncbi:MULTISPECIES: methionine adenosyltransferase [Bacillota]|jgi:S-adenosylmethionine synthetase|uniref:S-adenosylmethionine synthase n=1 Tax=Staphylococcus aureus TaxID=1280 RepID=A0A380EM25_STAAU|nr:MULTISPECIES: methionine adenosyltransferase [Bacillota]EIS9354408.1 methionine adenosyltransferase [Clostridioides difficile]EIS9362910.1 methionine adenosyltransferase [Clostridioides difficile]EIS9478936.1 methionine adenosyltransferase [Clostridioides difficile]EQH06222.1 methionine adenosyltransferase [Clostridioides difficile DA00196]EQI53460.1 methionine adenosyltransferase [Clostridioides difficile Y270]
MSKRYLTAESVCAGHPDKLCDIIADNILDECLRKDKASRVACEVMATKGKIIVAGEISCSEKIDIRNIVKNVLKELGYNPLKFLIYVYVHNQSSDIASGVNTALEARNGINEQYGSIGAGDQGTMYGYATKETREMLPLPLVLSHRIVKRLDEARKGKLIKGILPDGKAQVTIEYDDDVPVRVKTIVVSVQHEKNKTQEELKSDILNNVLWQCFEDFPFDDETEILINPSGQFVLGGPAADTGLTGRKIMVDTYGGLASHGGGALCGKDPTKVDRSGAYMARYIAKHIVWCDLAEKCEVAISYAIGKANPVAFSINTFGTGTVSDEVLTIATQEVFNLRPAAIIEKLRLRNIHYSDTAVYGHFNSCLFPWEDVNKYSELKEAVGKYADREN